jgi:transketolase
MKNQFNNDQQLHDFIKKARRNIVSMAYYGQTSHVGSALSCVDIIAVLYARVMNITAMNWQDAGSDRFILSKGHGVKALYSVLAQLGFFPETWLNQYGQDDSWLGEHPSHHVPGIICSTGSLGHGLSIAAGIALGQKLNKYQARTYVLISDGECNEGSLWEAAMAAAHLDLDNLVAIVDDNQWQAMGRSREVSALEPFAQKWEAFGWQVRHVDGHDLNALTGALNTTSLVTRKPLVIIAKTCLGKGVSFMEDQLLWHYQIPSQVQWEMALKELGA